MNLETVNPNLEYKINELVCEACNKNFIEQEKILKEAFELIPKPVNQWSHPTIMVATALAELFYDEGQYDKAEKWIDIALSVANLDAFHVGTYIFAGLFYYDTQRYDKAYDCFNAAYNEHGYSAFADEDKKYWKFYKQKRDELSKS